MDRELRPHTDDDVASAGQVRRPKGGMVAHERLADRDRLTRKVAVALMELLERNGVAPRLYTVRRGERVFAEGTASSFIAVVHDGLVVLTREPDEGDAAEVVVGLRVKNGLCDIGAVIGGAARRVSARAVCTSQLYVYDGRMARAVVSGDQLVALGLVQLFELYASERLFGCWYSRYRDAGERVRLLLTDLSECDALRASGEQRIAVPLRVCDIAFLTGLARETVCRVVTGMCATGVLRRRKGWLHVRRL